MILLFITIHNDITAKICLLILSYKYRELIYTIFWYKILTYTLINNIVWTNILIIIITFLRFIFGKNYFNLPLK